MTTRTSQDLLEEVTYPVAMHEIIDNRVRKSEPIINNLFVPQTKQRVFEKPQEKATVTSNEKTGEIMTLKNGFGFIKNPSYVNNLFFFFQSLVGVDFNDLKVGDKVQFLPSKNDKGEDIAKEVKLMAD
jgi:cold shock CspA family protein